MTWISLICLLALTSSALGRSAYGGSDYGAQTPLLSSSWSQRMIPKTILPTNTLATQSYGQTLLPSAPVHTPLVHAPTVETSSYQQQAPIQQSYGAQITLPKTLLVQSIAPASPVAYGARMIVPQAAPVQSYAQMTLPQAAPVQSYASAGYGATPMAPQHDQPAPLPVLTEADILCQGRQAQETIPIDNNRKFIICLDNGKGVEQQCPTGLFYHQTSQRCERTLGPLEDACSSQPCLNGGQCLGYGSSFQCQCTAGYEGTFCEIDARVCQTQQPCGYGSDVKCQSFRTGAALPYVCIFQGGLGYGLNAQQIIPSPCKGAEGAQALSISRDGFIMCDDERMFVESCPGGTVWDDVEKACSWPDQQVAPQEPKTLPSAYGYGSQTVPQQQQQPIQSYGAQIPVQRPTMIAAQTYGAQTIVPKQLTQSYGAQAILPQQQQPAMIPHKQLLQPTQSYGAQISLPKQLAQPTQSYGAQIFVPQQQQQQTMILPKQIAQPTQSYDAQIPLPKPLAPPTESYGAQIPLPKQLAQPAQSYGTQIFAPKQLAQPTQSYGAQIVAPQQQQQQQKVILPKQVVQPTQSYGSDVQVPQEPVKMIAHKDAPARNVATPYGAAQFPGSY